MLGLAAAAAGCTPSEPTRRGAFGMPEDPAQLWRSVPEEMRIYPATRFVLDRERAFLRLGVDVRDGLGDPVKAVGLLRCSLVTDGGDGGRAPQRGQGAGAVRTGGGEHLYGWEVRLATRAEQKTAWDPVARCYLVDLPLDSFAVASRPCRVRATLATDDGRELSAEAVMSTN